MTESVTRTTTHILVANISKNLALFAVLIIIPRVYGAADFGAFSLALAITTPFFAFALIGARVLRLTAPTSLSTKSIEISLIYTGLFALVCSALFGLVFIPDESKDSAIFVLFSAVIAVGLYKWGDLFTELYAGELQLSSNTNKLLIVSAISGGTLVLVSFVIASFQLQFHILLFGIVISGLLSSLFFSYVSRIYRTQGFFEPKEALRLGIPLGLAGAIGTLMSSTPQYFVAASYGPEMVGILAVILYVFSLADLFGGAYSQAWIHKIKEHSTPHQQLLYSIKVGVFSSLSFIPISIIGVWLFSAFAPLVFGARFTLNISEAIPLVIAISLLPLGHLVSIALLVRIAYKQSLAFMSLSAFSVVIVSLLAIPTMGISGALWAVATGIAVRVGAPLVYYRSLLMTGGEN